MAKPESEFPTIRDLRDRLSDLIEQGLGDHPVQVVVVPAATMLVIARATGAPDDKAKPPLMIELGVGRTERLPVSLVSVDFLSGDTSAIRGTH